MRSFCLTATAVLVAFFGFFSATAHAEQIFNTFYCPQHFSCDHTGNDQLSTLANDCSMHGFSIQTVQNNPFEDQVLDGNGCMTGVLSQNTTSGHQGVARCCVTPHDGDDCAMKCQLLVE